MLLRRDSSDTNKMARAVEDDLRRKFLVPHDRGRQTVREITGNFGVSYCWWRKGIDQRRRNGQAERVRHRSGPRSRLTLELHPAWARWRSIGKPGAFCSIDRGKGIVKGKDILTAAMSSA